MDWTTEAVAELCRLWVEGESASEIGRRLGCSRNSVISKVHRLELPPRPSPIRAEYQRPQRAWTSEEDEILRQNPDLGSRRFGTMLDRSGEAIRSRRAALGLAMPVGTTANFVVPAVTLPALPAVVEASKPVFIAPEQPKPRHVPRARECCWVEGERFKQVYCDAPISRGSYCAVHAALAYRSAA